jgi:hypothetical protein
MLVQIIILPLDSGALAVAPPANNILFLAAGERIVVWMNPAVVPSRAKFILASHHLLIEMAAPQNVNLHDSHSAPFLRKDKAVQIKDCRCGGYRILMPEADPPLAENL